MEYGFAFFPGQGAQAPGMGKDLYENSKAARLVFEEASDGAGIDVAKLCFESDKETLSRTENSQIAIFTHSMAALAALRENGVAFKAAAGFSLGDTASSGTSSVTGIWNLPRYKSTAATKPQRALRVIRLPRFSKAFCVWLTRSSPSSPKNFGRKCRWRPAFEAKTKKRAS